MVAKGVSTPRRAAAAAAADAAGLRWYTGVERACTLFIEGAHADPGLADACMTRFTLITLLALVGRFLTFACMIVAWLIAQWHEIDYLPTFGLCLLTAVLNVLVWPRPDVQKRTQARSGFFHACVRACEAHKEHADVQYGCLLQLGSAMTVGETATGSPSERVRKAGGAVAACAALRAHPRHDGIRLEGFSLLANLSYGGGEGAAAAIAAGAPAAIVGALADECPIEVQAQAAIALGNLTKDENSALALQQAVRNLEPAHLERLLGAFAHHPAESTGTTMRSIVEALGAINRSGAVPRETDATDHDRISAVPTPGTVPSPAPP